MRFSVDKDKGMDLPNLVTDLLNEYRWFILIPALMLVLIVFSRGQNRLLVVVVVLAGALIFLREHTLLRPLFSALNDLLLYLSYLFR